MIQLLKPSLKKYILTKYHENALTDTKEWLEERKLTLNLDKSKTKRNENRTFTQFLNILLCISIKKLELKDHVEVVNTWLNKFCGIIYPLRKSLNKQQLSHFYQTYVN